MGGKAILMLQSRLSRTTSSGLRKRSRPSLAARGRLPWMVVGAACLWGALAAAAPLPDIPPPAPENSVPMGSAAQFPEAKLDFPIAAGPFDPTWSSIETNYPGPPAWLREAKFGIWVHFGPQAAGQSGDWYARNLYNFLFAFWNKEAGRPVLPPEDDIAKAIRLTSAGRIVNELLLTQPANP